MSLFTDELIDELEKADAEIKRLRATLNEIEAIRLSPHFPNGDSQRLSAIGSIIKAFQALKEVE